MQITKKNTCNWFYTYITKDLHLKIISNFKNKSTFYKQII